MCADGGHSVNLGLGGLFCNAKLVPGLCPGTLKKIR
jgi:hypothetical protein